MVHVPVRVSGEEWMCTGRPLEEKLLRLLGRALCFKAKPSDGLKVFFQHTANDVVVLLRENVFIGQTSKSSGSVPLLIQLLPRESEESLSSISYFHICGEQADHVNLQAEAEAMVKTCG